MSKHVISIDAQGNHGTLLVDGVDVSNWCVGYTITHPVRRAPEVTITLIPDELIFRADEATVALIRALMAEPDAVPV